RVPGLDFKRVNGGLLVQDRDLGMVSEAELRVVSKRQPTEQELENNPAPRYAPLSFGETHRLVVCCDDNGANNRMEWLFVLWVDP
ncbi:hypothetical protein MJI20_30880, partial [Salmonella enterica subsp. enterica serovar Anatum]|nr:hypothetical protein [Salmonella enterica subsp. enterica serovar Anatum]